MSVSPDGINWTVVKTWTISDSDNVYKLVDIDLSSFTMTSQFYIAFEGNMGNSADRLLIDNVSIDTEVAAPAATATPVPATATPVPSVIASDDWESGEISGGTGWLSAWTEQGGGDTSVTSQNSPFAGTYHLRLRSADGYASRDLDLSGRSGVHLTFYAKVSSFEGSDNASVMVSSDGTNWSTVKTWTSTDSDNVYKLVDIDLSGFTMTSQFFIAFEGYMSNSGDRLLIDNVEVE